MKRKLDVQLRKCSAHPPPRHEKKSIFVKKFKIEIKISQVSLFGFLLGARNFPSSSVKKRPFFSGKRMFSQVVQILSLIIANKYKELY